MALTYAQGKVIVARTIGGSFDIDQLNAAGDAILMAIQEWNLRQKWNYLLTDTAPTNINFIAGTATYQLPSTIREPYDARLITSQKRQLQYVEQRDLDRVVYDQTLRGVPYYYNLFRGNNAFDASDPDSQAGFIRVWPIPNYTTTSTTGELYVKYYRVIAEPTADVDTLDVPDRYVRALLTMAKYYYLVDKDAESARTEHHRAMSEQLFRWAERDDQEIQDDDLSLQAQIDYKSSWAPDYWWP